MMTKKKTMTTTTTTTKKKNILVFSIFTLSFVAAAAAAAAAILDIFSQSSFWKKTKTKTKKKTTIQLLKEEKPNPKGGGVVVGSTSTSPPPDRISELPVEILHRILGFLEMDEFLIGTSLVSTKWRNLWKSVPILKFPNCIPTSRKSRRRRRRNDDDDDDDDGIRNNVKKYQNFVDNVLRLRDSEASKIQIFRHRYEDTNSRGGFSGYGYLERLHNFIVTAAVYQGAQEIIVRGTYLVLLQTGNNNMIIHFNPNIFTSLIRRFTFAICINDFLIQLPHSMCCATQLTHLFLTGIRLPEGNDDAQLHLVCPLLETFHMINCYSEHLKVLDISAPRLNTLSINNERFGDFDILGRCRIEIRTPNLTSLAYKGRVYVDCFTVNLPRIANASLIISEEHGKVEQTTSFAFKLLKGLTSAKSLTLKGFKFSSQDTLKYLLASFTSLRNLELVTNCSISSIHGMVHFLNRCSSVEKLYLVLEVDTFVEIEGDELLMLPQCRLTHLKHVHIKRLRGHENEIEFVKFLLKSSVVLKHLIINTTADPPKRLLIEENLKQFIEEEPLFRSIKLCVL